MIRPRWPNSRLRLLTLGLLTSWLCGVDAHVEARACRATHEHADGSQVAAAYPARSWRKKSDAWLKINLNATSINSDRCNGCAASRATNNWAAEIRLKLTLKKMRQVGFSNTGTASTALGDHAFFICYENINKYY